MSDPRHKTIQVRMVPAELWREVRVAAAFAGQTLREWFLEAIREKLERGK